MAKNRYGVTPWGSWFIEILDSYEMGARLDRGRTYANTGRVLSLDLDEGKAAAKVEGNYRPFYRVEIVFPPLKEREKVYRMIEEDPALLSRIAAGELPEEFLEKLKKAGIDLIPTRWKSMKRSCTCPDYGDPCKHMAALYYIIAREVDSDPGVLFRLRGMDLVSRFGKSAARDIPPPFVVSPAGKTSANTKTPDTAALAETVLCEIPHCAGLISSLLPPSPPFSDRDFAFTLSEFYHYAARFNSWDYADDTDKIEHRFSRSRWTLRCASPGPGAEPVLEEIDIQGNKHSHSVFDAYRRFAGFSSDDGTDDYMFLFYLFKFLGLLIDACAFIPYVLTKDDRLKVIWKPYDTLPQIAQALDAIANLERGMLPFRKLRASGRSVVDLLSSALLGEWVQQNWFARKGSGGSSEYRELLEVFFQGAGMDTSSPALRALPVSIDRWLSVLHIDFGAWRYSFTVKNIRAKTPDDSESGDDEAIDFTLSMDVLLENNSGTVRTPLSKIAAGRNKIPGLTQDDILSILRPPTALSNYLPEIRSLMTHDKTALSEKRLAAFLESASGLLARLGISVNLPKALSRELKPRLVLRAEGKEQGGVVSYLDLNSLLDWQWQVAIGERILDIKEFEKLVKQKRALVRFRDGFVRIDTEELASLLKKAQTGQPGINDFLRAHLAGDSVLSFDAGGIIRRLFEERQFDPPVALTASLRPYQKRGYNWACSLLMAGFGCTLADDMGLGKTVQAIAVLLRLREEGLLEHNCLIIAPAALLENWEKELSRFAPSLKVSRYHGTGRRLDRKKYQVFLTTYQTAARDSDPLKQEIFSLLIVDEAHLMKNAETRMSRAVKSLRPQFRLALSGTPVENRLEDLRSLFDFILPGYLGSAAEFRNEFRRPIEALRSREKAEALRKITAPFLLRRLKTDKSIIRDLPEKIVSNEYAVLEKEQAALYESIVAETMKKSETIEAENRPALVLSLLTSLKQVCDHPRVYDKESPAISALSGKARLLLTLLEEILASREKVLVFSQYVETLDCLFKIITAELGEAALIYHGSMNQKARALTIDRFQNDSASRLMLVSLKAGGLGLNLTAASRVIHYDLWYNPAVENQATDRAFRIGQKRNVFVHRFITKNSFEEKIDAMITGKKELAEMTVSSGESWLARMSHKELKELFERQGGK
ncbi:MAG: DEAD/DEAH box helicase family protein [Treponema sp.]|jgi:superfamily II DNA or RNA helicase|nr:DEAD/DEAH box helicase family protein [Treponema sp.]